MYICKEKRKKRNFGEDQVLTRWAAQVMNAEASLSVAQALKATMSQNVSIAGIRKVLAKTKSMDKAVTSGKQKPKVEIDDDGFKIPQGTAHHSQKKLVAAECRKVIDRVLKMDLNPSDYLVNNVKVRHKLSPYGLSDQEWRCYLLHLVNQDPKKLTLPQVARKLVKELEMKTSDVELTIDYEKDPLSTKAMKEAKLYLAKLM